MVREYITWIMGILIIEREYSIYIYIGEGIYHMDYGIMDF